MQPKDLYGEMQLLFDRLDSAVASIRGNGAAYAQAYHDYRVALGQKLLDLEAAGKPATTSLPIAKSDKKVARHKYEEIANEAIYKANLEAINATKLKIRVIEAQIAREYAEVQGI